MKSKPFENFTNKNNEFCIIKKTRGLQNLANLYFLFKYHRLMNSYNGPNKNGDMANTRDAPTRGETIQVPSHNPKLISLHPALLAIQISWWLHPVEWVEWGGIGDAPKFHHFHPSNSHGASIMFEVSKDIKFWTHPIYRQASFTTAGLASSKRRRAKSSETWLWSTAGICFPIGNAMKIRQMFMRSSVARVRPKVFFLSTWNL